MLREKVAVPQSSPDAATTLADEIKARHQEETAETGDYVIRDDDPYCCECEQDWPCDAVRAADMLLELARENAAMTRVESLCFPCAEKMRDALHAARNATQEKP